GHGTGQLPLRRLLEARTASARAVRRREHPARSARLVLLIGCFSEQVDASRGRLGVHASSVIVRQAPRPSASSIHAAITATVAVSDIPMWPAVAPFRSSLGASLQSATPSTASAPTPGLWRP